MLALHTVQISVFCKPEEDKQTISDALHLFLPFDLEKEKIAITQEQTEGFENKIITIFRVHISKENHTTRFLENFLSHISASDRKLLLAQADTRLDDDLQFFVRIDKEQLIRNKEFRVSDTGNCFHIKMNIACFPKKRSAALEVVKRIFEKKEKD